MSVLIKPSWTHSERKNSFFYSIGILKKSKSVKTVIYYLKLSVLPSDIVLEKKTVVNYI